jgi:sulfhydrogenase subunit beta (sulfur reductase)
MSLTINQKDIKVFIAELLTKGLVYGPIENKSATNARYKFGKINKPTDYVMRYGPTVIPPKKYLFPAREDIFKFEKGEILPPTNREFVLFGVNKKDAEGLYLLDKIFSEPIPDQRYLKRREQMRLIVVDSMPPSNNIDCDVYLQTTADGNAQAYIYTEFGEKIVSGNKLFGHVAEAGELSSRHMPDEVVFHPRIDEIIENSKGHKVWDRLAKECFTCGICSYVCPLCYCFEENDRIDITAHTTEDVKGGRERRWDSCMLPEFAKISFENYREKPKDRIYNWYYHKFVRMPRELGFVGCIDCARCITFCPAKINYRKVLEELIKDERKAK